MIRLCYLCYETFDSTEIPKRTIYKIELSSCCHCGGSDWGKITGKEYIDIILEKRNNIREVMISNENNNNNTKNNILQHI